MERMIMVPEKAMQDIQRILHELTEQVADAIKVGVDTEAARKERENISKITSPGENKAVLIL
jgi:hypothetical protein